jgi:hypothetical protein
MNEVAERLRDEAENWIDEPRQTLLAGAEEIERLLGSAQDAAASAKELSKLISDIEAERIGLVTWVRGGYVPLDTETLLSALRLAVTRSPAEVEGMAQLGVQEIADAWAVLESHGFPPEAVGLPQENIAGKLPGAIDNAIAALATTREDLIKQRDHAVSQVETARTQAIEECAAHLEQLGARFHSGRDIVQRLRMLAYPSTMREGMRWSRVNDEPFEYAITQGDHGDEFVKQSDGTCLRRPA